MKDLLGILFSAVGFGFISFILFMALLALLGNMVFMIYFLFAMPGVIVGTGLGVVQALKGGQGEEGTEE